MSRKFFIYSLEHSFQFFEIAVILNVEQVISGFTLEIVYNLSEPQVRLGQPQFREFGKERIDASRVSHFYHSLKLMLLRRKRLKMNRMAKAIRNQVP